MKCAMCGRPLISPALLINSRQGPLGFGPVCARKAMPGKPRTRKVKPGPVRDCSTVDWVEAAAA